MPLEADVTTRRTHGGHGAQRAHPQRVQRAGRVPPDDDLTSEYLGEAGTDLSKYFDEDETS